MQLDKPDTNRLVKTFLACLLFAHGHVSPEATNSTATAAQVYRAGGEPVKPNPDGNIFCEAEEFKITTPGWKAKDWGANYYAATFANTFLSRKAFLGAPEQTDGAEASIEVEVTEAGKYLALVRYEAAYRFETQFKLRIEQGGNILLDRLYGARDNLKIWAFKTGKERTNLQKEVAWYWGAVENIVWEGHNVAVNLKPGRAKITLTAGRQNGDAAKRNIDLVMLTRDEEHVKLQLAKAGRLPLDGMLTQAGDVFARVQNLDNQNGLKMAFPQCQQHSPYWVHIRRWKTVSIEVEPGGTSEWTDVGGVLDTMNDGQWSINANSIPKTKGAKPGPPNYRLEFGVKTASGTIEQISEFRSNNTSLSLAFHADTRYSRKLRDSANVLYDLLDYLKKQPARGKIPEQTMIFCYTFSAREKDPKYTAALDEFIDMFNLAVGRQGNAGSDKRGYIDVRSVPTEGLAAYCLKLGDAAKNIACVSLGDEIGLPNPGKDVHEEFRTWLKGLKLKPSKIVPKAGKDWSRIEFNRAGETATKSPGLYYWSMRYAYHYGIQAIKVRTDILRKHLPNARIGANFSPHHGSSTHGYLGETYKWVTLFREEGMTMPWSEDYIWQLPVGTQQMNFINLDLSRAGLRHKPDAKIHYYVMPHWPGNTPNQWRRQFYGDVGHGMKIVNLFEFRPVQAAYTENHVTHGPMYLQVRTAFREMGLFEDIMQDGQVRPGFAGLWFSETGDIWGDARGSLGPAKRALYVAIRHQQIPLDFVVEQDAHDGTLGQYKVLYLADAHVSSAASKQIESWVKKGGRLFATAGAGMFDEYNRPNKVLRKLLGADQSKLQAPQDRQVGFLKQDLPFTDPVDTASGSDGASWKVFGVKSVIRAGKAKVIGKFSDGLPALLERKLGKGKATTCAFLPGLSYFKPALPRRPVDRGSSDDAYSHFIPTQFDAASGALIASVTEGIECPVDCSEPLVESSVIESRKGILIPLVNWSAGPVKGLKVKVNIDVLGKSVSLATGGKVSSVKDGNATVFMLDLEVADALILK